MNYGRFFMPNVVSDFYPAMALGQFSKGPNIGVLGRITNSIRRFNWNSLINGANKTLNVVNQTIPIIRQTGPMINNMKNIFKITKAFGNETSQQTINKSLRNQKSIKNDDYFVSQKKEEVVNNNYPNFFI